MAAWKTDGCTWLLAIVFIGVTSSGCGPGEPTVGVVVEACDRGGAADVAGLLTGDAVLEWRHGRASGDVDSPFRLALVEQELSPHGPVEVTILRRSTRQRVEISRGLWRLATRPVMEPADLARHLEAERLAADDDFDGAAELWTVLAAACSDRGRPLVAAWIQARAGLALARSGRPADSHTALQAGADFVTDRRLCAAYWENSGAALLDEGQTAVAADAFRKAIEILEADIPSSPALAHTLLQLCRTDLRSSAAEAARAGEIYSRLSEKTIETANVLNMVATNSFFHSDLDAAETRYTEALEIAHELAPGSATELNLLGNLGLVAMRRGDFETARSYFRREETAAEQLGADTLQYAFAANYLGLLAKKVGRYEMARLHYEKALTSFRLTKPDGPEVAGVLTNLGNVALREADFEAALRYHEEALALRQRLDPRSPDVAASFNNVGTVARTTGDLDHARSSLERALELKLELGPGTVLLSSTIFELGEIAREEMRLDAAESLHLQALEIRHEISPDDPKVAESLFALGGLQHARGNLAEAERLWRESIAMIEDRRRRIRLSQEAQSRFGAVYDSQFGSLARLLVDQDRLDEAWECLEEARAVELRSMVAHRDTAPSAIPAELWFAKTRLEQRLSRLENRLATIDPEEDPSTLDRSRTQLTSVVADLEDMNDEILMLAPRYANLDAPPTMTLDRLRRSLSPGTVVLTYTIGNNRSMVMVTGAGADGGPRVRAFDIHASWAELRGRVDRFNALIARGRSIDEIEPAFLVQAQRLFKLLMGPASEAISTATRVLIIPDGPLHELPFAALVMTGGYNRFLGHEKPLYINPSASLAVELGVISKSTESHRRTIAAFGDPHYPRESPEVEKHGLKPLPGARTETEAIHRLFGSRATAFVGKQATENNLREHAGEADVLHFAVHARVDPRVSMDSALYFSLPGNTSDPEEDGVLTAWEIADTLQVGADLVVLSSCSTARGRVVPGEGIIGLARAFHVAGARSLVASQWAVPDASTATLMTTFYEGLADGHSTAEALRHAQKIVGSEPTTAHPYHWAAFQVRGDWR